MRRRLLWTSVVFGLLLLVAVVSVLRAALWVRDVARTPLSSSAT